MIKVKYIPCLLEETCYEMETHNTGLIPILVSFARTYSATWNDNAEGLCVRLNGEKVSPFQLKKIVLKDGDEVLLVQEIGAVDVIGGITLAISAVGAYVGGGITLGAMIAAVTPVLGGLLEVVSIASTIYSLCTQSKGPDRQGALPNSPTYGWEGVRLQVQPGAPVPVIYGQHLISGTVMGRG